MTASGPPGPVLLSAGVSLRCLRVSVCPSSSPTSGSTSRRLASLHRVPWVGSPASSVRSRRYDSLTSFPPRFVSFAWRYRDLPHRFAPARGWDSYAHRPGLFSAEPKTAASYSRRRQGLPGSWVDPRVWTALLVDPGLVPCARPLQRRNAAAALLKHDGPIDSRPFEALSHSSHSRCLRFAACVTAGLAQDSLPAGGQPLPGRILTCRVHSRRFPCRGFFVRYISPSSRFSLARSE